MFEKERHTQSVTMPFFFFLKLTIKNTQTKQQIANPDLRELMRAIRSLPGQTGKIAVGREFIDSGEFGELVEENFRNAVVLADALDHRQP